MHYAVVPHGRSAVGWSGVPGGTSPHAYGCPCLGCCDAYGYGADPDGNETNYVWETVKAAGAGGAVVVTGSSKAMVPVTAAAATALGVSTTVLLSGAFAVVAVGYILYVAWEDDKLDEAEAVDLAVAFGVKRGDAEEFAGFLETALFKWKQSKRKEELKDLDKKIKARDAKSGKYAWESAFVTEEFYQATTKKRRLERAMLKIIVDAKDGKLTPEQKKVKAAVDTVPPVERDPVTKKRTGRRVPITATGVSKYASLQAARRSGQKFTVIGKTATSSTAVGGRDAEAGTEEGPFGLQASYGGVNTYVLIALAAAGASYGIYRATRTRN